MQQIVKKIKIQNCQQLLELGFLQTVRDHLQNSANGPGPFAEFCKRSGTVYRILQTVPDRLQNSGGSSDKNTFFGGFLQVLCAVSYFFIDNLYMKCLFCKKNCPI